MGWKKIQLGGSCFRRQEVPSGDRRAGTWTSQQDARDARFPDWLVYFFFLLLLQSESLIKNSSLLSIYDFLLWKRRKWQLPLMEVESRESAS